MSSGRSNAGSDDSVLLLYNTGCILRLVRTNSDFKVSFENPLEQHPYL